MYDIKFVDDDALPQGHDFLFAQIPGGALIFYRRSALSEESLKDSWAAYRALGGPNRDRPDARRSAWLALVHSA